MSDIDELVAIIDNAVLDYDGSQEVDGAEPVRIPNCGQLRSMKAAMQRLAADSDQWKARAEKAEAALKKIAEFTQGGGGDWIEGEPTEEADIARAALKERGQ